MVRMILNLLCLCLPFQVRAVELSHEPLVFRGMCDASAAAALAGDTFVVANDEDNILRFYRVSHPGNPFFTYDLKPILSTRKKAPEADFEGAARLSNRVFWITSHGRTAAGKPAPLRHRLVALEFSGQAERPEVKLVGQPYTNLVSDLIQDNRFDRFNLRTAAQLPPKAPGGLNIEALTDTPNGALLIGFRSPLVNGKAFAVPLLNPNDVITGASPEFGEALLFDLGGLGLRGIGSTGGGYYLIGGPSAGDGECRLFSWDGAGAPAKLLAGIRLPGINPEGICFHDSAGKPDFVLLSDDGTRKIGETECKSLPMEQRQFRAFRLR